MDIIDLNLLYSWLHLKYLTFNISKTKYMLINPLCKNKLTIKMDDPSVNNSPIEKVNIYKYLGLIIDSDLKWDHHM